MDGADVAVYAVLAHLDAGGIGFQPLKGLQREEATMWPQRKELAALRGLIQP